VPKLHLDAKLKLVIDNQHQPKEDG